MPQSFTLLLDQVNQVGAAKGKQKEAVLASFESPELGIKPVINYALNPRITFGVGKKTITEVEANSPETFADNVLTWDKAKTTLDLLAERELTGGAALSALVNLKASHCADSWELLKRILIKDLRGSFSAKTANRVWKGFIPLFEVQLAHKYTEKKVKAWPADAEVKHDGVRSMAEIDMATKTVTMFSRTGNEFTTFDSLKGDILGLIESAIGNSKGKFYLDGEIKSGEFAKTAGDIHRKDADITDAVFYVFDFLTAEEFWNNSSDINFKRRKRLQALFKKAGAELVTPEPLNIEGVREQGGEGAKWMNLRLIEQYEVQDDAAAQRLFGHFYGLGEEGIILKPRHENYQRKRHNGFLKMKNAISEDLKIVGFEKGERDTKYSEVLGALVVDFNGVKVNVSSGLKHDQRFEFWENREELLGRIIEVGAHEVTPDGSLRHPRFIRFRDTVKKGEKE